MRTLILFCRTIVGSLFIVSGLIKANDPLGFSYKLEEYFAGRITTFATPLVLLETGGTTMKSSELIAISTFRSAADAQIAKGILDEAGIQSMIRSDNAGGMYPAISGADLLVRAEDAEKAAEALRRRHRR